MWFYVRVMVGEGLDAVRQHTLLPDPLEGLPLEFLVLANAGGNHLLPGFTGVAPVGKQEYEFSVGILYLYGEKASAMPGDIDQHNASVAKEIEGLLHWTNLLMTLKNPKK